MRIVTLNTWKNEGEYERRLVLMAEGLAALEPDVVLLQEAFACDGADTAAVLAARLGLSVSAFPARMKPRRHLDRQVLSTSGLAILSRGPLRTRAKVLASHPLDGERIAVLAESSGDDALRILNLHLSHLRGDLGRDLRARQLEEALAWALEDWSGGLILGGDLNAGRADPELLRLPAYAAPSERLGSTLIYAEGRGGAAIDHIVLIDPSHRQRIDRTFLALNGADDSGCFASDHAAVVADIA